MIKIIYSLLLATCCCFFVTLRTEARKNEEVKFEILNTYLISPANQNTTAGLSQTCIAKSIPNAAEYSFELSTVEDFSSDVRTFTSSTNSVVVKGLTYATKYYAHVKSNLNSTYGVTTTFTTKSSEQYAFVSKPSNASSNNDAVELKVTANSVSGAKRYTIELNTSPDFSGPSLIASSIIDFQRTLVFKNLQYLTKYYARVKTDLSNAYGKVTSFTTRAEQLSFVSEPSDNAAGLTHEIIKIVVAPVYQAKRYTVELSTTPDFSSVLLTNKSLNDFQRTFVFEKLKPATTYYARAKTDVSTDFGNVTSFSTRAVLTKHRLWGVTTSGGSNGGGTVFSFSLDSLTFTKHHDNTSTEYLHGGLTAAPGGDLYGMGIQYSTGDAGEIYKIDERGNYSVVYNNGGIHFGSLMLASNYQLYTVDDWINSFRGGIRKLSLDGSDVDVLASIFYKFRSDTDGKNPIAAPLELGEYLYGMTPGGGLYKKGVIYRKKFDGSVFQVLYNFNGPNGANPQGRLTVGSDGYLYGLTFSGGLNNEGTIFKIQPDGTNFTKLFDFSDSEGKYPFGELIQSGDSFYGMASEGGAYDNGVIFKINFAGAFTRLFNFNGSNGAIPLGSLSMDDEGLLYGMTANGGANDLGVIFRIKSDGTEFTKLYDFSSGGGNPDGTPIIKEDTFGSGSAARMLVSNENETQSSEIITRIYPNPFVSTLTVEMNSLERDFSVTLTDISGRVVFEEKTNHALQIGNNLAQGVYIVKVISGTQVVQQRVVKR